METIYISLLNEGTSTWRPIEALKLEEGLYLIPLDSEAPEDEEWEFRAGTKVKCKNHTFSDGKIGLIAYATT